MENTVFMKIVIPIEIKFKMFIEIIKKRVISCGSSQVDKHSIDLNVVPRSTMNTNGGREN